MSLDSFEGPCGEFIQYLCLHFCIQNAALLLLQQGVGPLQGLVLPGQLTETQLRLLIGQAL